MIGAWMLYGLVVGGLLAVGAAALERVLRAYGRPARWVWAGVVVGTAAAPVAVWLVGGRPQAHGGAGGVVLGAPEVVSVLPSFSLAAAARPVLEALNGPLAVLWLLGTAALVLYLATAALGLRVRRRGWRADSVEGERVLVSRDVGPAVLGWLRGTVVLPEWALRLEPGWRRLVVAHEREHMRARDPALLALGYAALALLPWNLALWWQVRRLRLAVEMDCDERVLRAHPDVNAYGGLLLEVGRRASQASALLAALSEPRSFLERRIRRMVGGRGRHRVVQAAVLAAASVAVVVLACETPVPERVMGWDEPARLDVAELAERPSITPYTVAPELRNREATGRALAELYPPLLRDAGIGGRALVWFLIDEAGTVQKVVIKEPSGHAALDDAALRVAAEMEFTPPLNRGKAVPVWVALPIEFRPL